MSMTVAMFETVSVLTIMSMTVAMFETVLLWDLLLPLLS
jgi:hypothetical protein